MELVVGVEVEESEDDENDDVASVDEADEADEVGVELALLDVGVLLWGVLEALEVESTADAEAELVLAKEFDDVVAAEDDAKAEEVSELVAAAGDSVDDAKALEPVLVEFAADILNVELRASLFRTVRGAILATRSMMMVPAPYRHVL